jgi:hypothetical protein
MLFCQLGHAQSPRIKTFVGTSANAVMVQI